MDAPAVERGHVLLASILETDDERSNGGATEETPSWMCALATGRPLHTVVDEEVTAA
jgi:hypothetical protein